jgi:cardiolipin hydrolase
MKFLRVLCVFLLGFSFIDSLFSSDAQCEVYFSPKDHLAERLIQLIQQEKKSVKVAVFCVTHPGITKALIEAWERGVKVEVIVDPFSVKVRSCVHRLAKANVPLFVWDPSLNLQGKSFKGSKKRNKEPIMHDKFCVLGESITWTGSFNFTQDGNLRNEENAVIIESSEVAKKYLEHFGEIKVYGCRPFGEYLAFHPKKHTLNKLSTINK